MDFGIAHKNGLQPTMTVNRRPFLLIRSGRGDWIRTSDFSVPNRALYQAEPRPDGQPILSQLSALRSIHRIGRSVLSDRMWEFLWEFCGFHCGGFDRRRLRFCSDAVAQRRLPGT